MKENGAGIQPGISIPPSQEFGDGIPTRGVPFRLAEASMSVQQLPCLQRQCKPHRGRLLWALGVASLGLGGLTTAFFPLAIFAMPFSLITWFVARFDLAKIQDGFMDPCGERLTYEAINDSMAGFVLSCSGLIIWGAIFFCMVLVH